MPVPGKKFPIICFVSITGNWIPLNKKKQKLELVNPISFNYYYIDRLCKFRLNKKTFSLWKQRMHISYIRIYTEFYMKSAKWVLVMRSRTVVIFVLCIHHCKMYVSTMLNVESFTHIYRICLSIHRNSLYSDTSSMCVIQCTVFHIWFSGWLYGKRLQISNLHYYCIQIPGRLVTATQKKIVWL